MRDKEFTMITTRKVSHKKITGKSTLLLAMGVFATMSGFVLAQDNGTTGTGKPEQDKREPVRRVAAPARRRLTALTKCL